MTYKEAVHHAHLVLSLCSKASRYVRDLLDAPDVRYDIVIWNVLTHLIYLRMKWNQLD